MNKNSRVLTFIGAAHGACKDPSLSQKGGLGSDQQSAATNHAARRHGPLLDRALLASNSLGEGDGGLLTSCSLLRWGDSKLDSRAASRTRC